MTKWYLQIPEVKKKLEEAHKIMEEQRQLIIMLKGKLIKANLEIDNLTPKS